MDEILTKKISEMTCFEFDCSCGRHHEIHMKHIYVGEDVCKNIIDIALELNPKNILLVADNNTYNIMGAEVENILANAKFSVKSIVLHSQDMLRPDEAAVGRVLIEANNDTGLIVAVGSGTINDICRIISYRMKLPYVVVATAPSMDGYASSVSPLIVKGKKITYNATAPYAVIADTAVLSDAPYKMICAGFGDILGKYTALADWHLSNIINGEYFCDTTEKLVREAMAKCLTNIQGAVERDSTAIGYIAAGLILSGVAMTITGNSRPASGAEHHMSHYWEMDYIKKGIEHPLHGNCVGVGTVISSYIYQMTGVGDRYGIDVPDPEEVIGLLKTIGADATPQALGISRDLFYNSLMHAMELRPRYTILTYASDNRKLGSIASDLTDMYY